MSVLAGSILLAVLIPLILVLVRDRGSSAWWKFFIVESAIMVTVVLVCTWELPAPERWGIMMLFLIPNCILFVSLREDIFLRRIYLIALLGPLVYAVGFFVALSFVVGLGLLQP